ncbi:MAG: VanZ family protein [Chloroflexi bacterium]|nr:VanZ family protein [Chloroflexota bacterium]
MSDCNGAGTQVVSPTDRHLRRARISAQVLGWCASRTTQGRPPRIDTSLLAWGIAFASSIEFIKLLMNIDYGFPYRVVDVNDFLLNALGVVLGLAAFRLVAAMYGRMGPADERDRESYRQRVLSRYDELRAYRRRS